MTNRLAAYEDVSIEDDDDDVLTYFWNKFGRKRWLITLVLPVIVVWNIALSQNLTTLRYFPTTDAMFESTEHNATRMPSLDIVDNTTSNITNQSSNSSTIINQNAPSNSNTIIVGFSDVNYKDIAWRWYQELTKLGYTEHLVVAQDLTTKTYFEHHEMRHDYIHAVDLEKESLPFDNFTNFRKERCSDYDQKYGNAAKQHQLYKRSLFGSRWTYVLRQLEAGKNVLLTDVDNVFVKHQDLSVLEQEPYDSIHAYAGFLEAFPRNIFFQTGFTICGGMSWLRAAPGVIEVVSHLVQRCGCMSTLHCHCKCDDQVVFNGIMLLEQPYRIEWDQNVSVPHSIEEVRWDEMTGTCPKTGHRVKIWNRHVAFRRILDPEVCPDPKLSWIAMPSGVDRTKVYDEWKAACPLE